MNLKLEYQSFQEFASEVWPCLSEEAMWVPSEDPAGVGEVVDFDVTLADGFRLFHGTGHVVSVGTGPADGPAGSGMMISFDHLDRPSRNLIRKVVSKHVAEGGTKFEPKIHAPKVELVGDDDVASPTVTASEPDSDEQADSPDPSGDRDTVDFLVGTAGSVEGEDHDEADTPAFDPPPPAIEEEAASDSGLDIDLALDEEASMPEEQDDDSSLDRTVIAAGPVTGAWGEDRQPDLSSFLRPSDSEPPEESSEETVDLRHHLEESEAEQDEPASPGVTQISDMSAAEDLSLEETTLTSDLGAPLEDLDRTETSALEADGGDSTASTEWQETREEFLGALAAAEDDRRQFDPEGPSSLDPESDAADPWRSQTEVGTTQPLTPGPPVEEPPSWSEAEEPHDAAVGVEADGEWEEGAARTAWWPWVLVGVLGLAAGVFVARQIGIGGWGPTSEPATPPAGELTVQQRGVADGSPSPGETTGADTLDRPADERTDPAGDGPAEFAEEEADEELAEASAPGEAAGALEAPMPTIEPSDSAVAAEPEAAGESAAAEEPETRLAETAPSEAEPDSSVSPVKLERITFRREGATTVVSLGLDRQVTVDRIENLRVAGGEPRHVVKILGIAGQIPETVEIGTGEVVRLRFGKHRVGGTMQLHVVADLTGGAVEWRGPVEIDGRTLQVRFAGAE